MAGTEKKDGKCDEVCPAGKYVQAKCNATQQTKCGDCQPGTYTASSNHLPRCLSCHVCLPSHKLRTVSNCTTERNTVCECETGYYCSNDVCDHCQKLTECPPGEGVKIKATRRADTVCAKCEEGTYSNVTDYSSPCIAHTRCEDYGRKLETPGSPTANAVCGDFKGCSRLDQVGSSGWMLPAGLWSGFVLTILIVAVFLFFWRVRRKSHRASKSRVPDTPMDIAPMPDITPPDLSSHCQETCAVDSCKLHLFDPDNPIEDYTIKDSFDSSVPITPMKVSFSFAESNGSGGFSKGNFFRWHSEPQEDEWSGAE